MRFVLFTHSLVSDWNHGNAHFLRGVVSELLARGHEVAVHEPRDGWSRSRLVDRHGNGPLRDFERRFPELRSRVYDPATLDAARVLDGADVVVVHEWTHPDVVRAVADRRGRGPLLLFHDTHHRVSRVPEAAARAGIDRYDAVLAFGRSLAERYRAQGIARRIHVWHEGADTRRFRPLPAAEPEGDLVWIGNWGDGERARELRELLFDPARALRLRGRVHGVRYPAAARRALRASGLGYGGWLANHRVPEVYARFRVTVHVPRRPYAQELPGIPTIRPFEALACGIPLVCGPWEDTEGLFTPGRDYLTAADGAAMRKALRDVLHDDALARSLASHGLRTVRTRHTCAHRVDELLAICAELGAREARPRARAAGEAG